MKKLAIIFVWGLSLVFVSNSFGKTEDIDENKSAIAETTASLSAWMTDNYEKIKDKALKNLVIPGTHDSGTSAISEKNAIVSSDKGIPEALVKAKKNIKKITALALH